MCGLPEAHTSYGNCECKLTPVPLCGNSCAAPGSGTRSLSTCSEVATLEQSSRSQDLCWVEVKLLEVSDTLKLDEMARLQHPLPLFTSSLQREVLEELIPNNGLDCPGSKCNR